MTGCEGCRTAEGGRRAGPVGEGPERGHRPRVSMQGPGATVLRSWAGTPGQAGIVTRAPGHRASATVWAWRARAAGITGASGHRASRVAMGSWRAQPVGPAMREPGATAYRMDTALRHTLTEVRTKPTLTLNTYNMLLNNKQSHYFSNQDSLSTISFTSIPFISNPQPSIPFAVVKLL